MTESNQKRAKVFRDPVHDIISWDREAGLGPLIVALIDTPEFQRLRFVRQVGLASLVFHGAEHSRFAHSMGVATLARRMFDQLHPDADKEDTYRVATIVAGLLHDVGHAPFSHAMERVCGFRHEVYSELLVLDEGSRIFQTLRDYDPALPRRVAAYFDHSMPHHTRDIVSSQLDADRFDYLLRDSLMCGVEVGRYDLERILLMLDHDDLGLVVNIGAFESVEGYLIARYHMYRLVYFHKAVRAAEAMLRMAFERARDLLRTGIEVIDTSSPLGRLMMGEQLEASVFANLSEIDTWAQLRLWSHTADPILAELSRALVERRLFKSVDVSVDSEDDLEELVQTEAEIRRRLGDDWRYYFFVDVAQDEPYRPYLPGSAQSDAIRIRDRSGNIFSIEDRSALLETLANASYRLRRWCYHAKVHDVVSEATNLRNRRT